MYFIRSTGSRGFVVEKDYVDIYEVIFPQWFSKAAMADLPDGSELHFRPENFFGRKYQILLNEVVIGRLKFHFGGRIYFHIMDSRGEELRFRLKRYVLFPPKYEVLLHGLDSLLLFKGDWDIFHFNYQVEIVQAQFSLIPMDILVGIAAYGISRYRSRRKNK